jgi:hypothetical protein
MSRVSLRDGETIALTALITEVLEERRGDESILPSSVRRLLSDYWGSLETASPGWVKEAN